MAQIGLKGFLVADFAENATTHAITYTNGKKISKAVSLNHNKSTSDATLYADNGLDDKVTAIQEWTVDMTPNGVSLEDLSGLLGIGTATVSINGEEQTLTATTVNDEGDAKGVGYIVNERTSGTSTYKAVILASVKFKPAESEEHSTKGETTEFNTPAYTGTLFPVGNSTYYTFEKEFATETLAETWIGTMLDVAAE